jgi:hypothetical protein
VRAGAGRAREEVPLAVSGERLPVVRAGELEIQPPEQRWLFEGLWGRTAIGLIGGAPKCCLCRARHKQHHAASRVMPRRSGAPVVGAALQA